MHDPRLGRFFAIDPLASKYPWYSSYQFSGNKLIHAIELEGLEEFELNSNSEGGYTLNYNMDLKPLDNLSTNTLDKRIYFNGQVTRLGDIDLKGNFFRPTSGEEMIGNTDYYKFRECDFRIRHYLMGSNATPPSYYLGYGDKYVRRFRFETNKSLSSQGKVWLAETLVNLQRSIENEIQNEPLGYLLEINNLRFQRFAFDSHVDAYWNTNGTVPFFHLGALDLAKIGLTPDFEDLFSADGMKQMKGILIKLTFEQPEELKRILIDAFNNRYNIDDLLETKCKKEDVPYWAIKRLIKGILIIPTGGN
jgi:hypothetical protein